MDFQEQDWVQERGSSDIYCIVSINGTNYELRNVDHPKAANVTKSITQLTGVSITPGILHKYKFKNWIAPFNHLKVYYKVLSNGFDLVFIRDRNDGTFDAQLKQSNISFQAFLNGANPELPQFVSTFKQLEATCATFQYLHSFQQNLRAEGIYLFP